MTTAAVGSKGRVTIPRTVRDSLRLQTGDRDDHCACPGRRPAVRLESGHFLEEYMATRMTMIYWKGEKFWLGKLSARQ